MASKKHPVAGWKALKNMAGQWCVWRVAPDGTVYIPPLAVAHASRPLTKSEAHRLASGFASSFKAPKAKRNRGT